MKILYSILEPNLVWDLSAPCLSMVLEWLPSQYHTNLMYVRGLDYFFVNQKHKLFKELQASGKMSDPIEKEWYKVNESFLRQAYEKHTIVPTKPKRRRL